MDELTSARLRMVERDLVSRGIRSPAVIAAMRTVARHLFVPPQHVGRAYEDDALALPEGQSISQPYIVALMIEEAKLQPTDKVLEIGTGSGYAAAVASLVCQRLFSIERNPALAQLAALNLQGYANIQLRCADGTYGWQEEAPFDAILVDAAGPALPPALVEQLAIGGRLVMPMERSGEQRLVRVTRTGHGEYSHEELIAVRFVPLIGAHAGR